jgi:3-oxoacyl-[acyl-carrier-protein] synthase I
MDNIEKVYVAETGLISAAGLNTSMTCAAINAGISCYGPTGYHNFRDHSMTGTCIPDAALPELNEELAWAGLTGREKRLVRIASPALNEVIKNSGITASVPLFMAGPEKISSSLRAINGSLFKHIKKQTGINFDMGNCRYFASGRAGVLEAIDLAFKYFESTQAEYVIVGGIDSYIDPAVLSILDSERRVLAVNTNNGFAPGEGAAFLLLTRHYENSKYPVSVYKPGLGQEEGHRYSDKPYLGDGLADAFKTSISNAGVNGIDAVYSTLNGESFGSKEFGVACTRSNRFLSTEYEHIHPADCVGDMGAASGALLIILALNNYEKGKRLSPSIISCSSDLSNRAAVCLSKIV